MSSSTGQAEGWPAASDSPAAAPRGGARREPGRGNGYATAALALGAAGVTLITIVPGVVFGVLGLRRAAQRGTGRVRAWFGIGLCAVWAAAGAYLLPHLIRAADPGCTAYKGRALTAYNKVITDFNGNHRAPDLAADLSRAIGTLQAAASQSRSPGTAQALSVLTGDLRAVLGDIRTGAVVPARAMTDLNGDAARVDTACGTLHI
jgi:hypothetical protein